MPTTAPLTPAARAGRIAGTVAKGLIWAYRTIDWAEVAQIVIQGLKVLVVLTLLAGRGARRLWDALPAFSERIGRAYATWLVPQQLQVLARNTKRPMPAPQQAQARDLNQLEALTQRQLMALAGTRRKLAKRQLVAMLAAA